MLRAAIVVSALAFASAGSPVLETCPGLLFLSASEEGTNSTRHDMLPGRCIGEPRRLQWVNVNTVGLGCWDADLAFGTVGTPGGDFAELILAMNAYEQLSGNSLTEANITNTIQSYLGQFNSLTMCNSAAGVKNLIGKNFDGPNNMQEVPEGFNVTEALKRTSDSVRIGDKFLSAMASNYKEYGIRLGLIKSSVQSFFRVMWGKSMVKFSLKIVAVPFGNDADAVLKIRVPPLCAERGATPLILPTREESGTHAYVTNVDAVRHHRERVALFFTAGEAPTVTTEDLLTKMTELSALQLKRFLKDELKLPVFNVKIESQIFSI